MTMEQAVDETTYRHEFKFRSDFAYFDGRAMTSPPTISKESTTWSGSGAQLKRCVSWALVLSPTGDSIANIVSVVVIGLIVLATVKPGLTLPLSFIDEGYNVALANHFASTGQYATYVVGTPLRWFDPKVSTGPVQLLPVALGIRIAGLTLTSLRLDALAFFVLFLFSVYFVGRQVSTVSAGAAALILIGSTAYDLYNLGLRILGEVPSLLSLNIAFGCLSRRGWKWSVGAGIWAGLALLAKPQMAIAVIALMVIVIAVGWIGDTRGGHETACLIAGLFVPLVSWNVYEAVTVGVAEWFRLTNVDLGLAFYGSGAGRLLPFSLSMLGVLAASGIIVAFSLKLIVRRIPTLRGMSLPLVVARCSLVALLGLPLLFVHLDFVVARSFHLADHPIETTAALAGAVVLFISGMRLINLTHSAISSTTLLFAEWYFGLSADVPYRYSIYWRILGLACAGVCLDLAVRTFWPKVSDSLRHNVFGVKRAYLVDKTGYTVLAVGSMIFVTAHSMSVMQMPMDLSNHGAQDVADWVTKNTPKDAIVLGSGWWMPWESADLSNRDIADAYSSALEVPKDLMRRRYLVMPTRFLHSVDLHPDVVDVMGRPDLLLYQAGGYGVYRWPESVDLKRLKSVVSLSEDLLQSVNTGRVAFAPEPRSHALDPQHGNFWYPVVQRMLRGMYVISPAEMTVRNVIVGPSQFLLLGYVPPIAGDGLSLRVFVVRDGRARLVYYQYVRAAPSAADDYRIAEIPLGTSAGRSIDLTVRVSSDPSGDATSDWLFVGPLAIVSSTR